MLQFTRKIRVALTPNRMLLGSRLANGVIVYGKNRAGYGGRGIYVFRDAIEPELEQLDELVDPGAVFLDLGASTGIYTLKAARRVGYRGLVVAAEPNLEILGVLEHSVQRNRLSNVRLRHLAVGDETGVRTLWMNWGRPNTFSLLRRDGQARGMSTLTARLDDLASWEGLERVDYIKIDVEGAEREVLDGGRTTISRFRPILQMETSVRDFDPDLPDYTSLRAAGSPNVMYLPRDHEKIRVLLELGWERESRTAR